MDHRTCIIDGCEKPARSSKADWCKMHYHRWYRHGSTDVTSTRSGITVSLGRRYRQVYDKHHPLAMRDGRVYQHRQVLFNEIGHGPHACHWCSIELDWLSKGDPHNLIPDHLNGDGADNRIDNLVPSCAPCNSARAAQARANALRGAGWWSHHDTIARLANGGRSTDGRSFVTNSR